MRLSVVEVLLRQAPSTVGMLPGMDQLATRTLDERKVDQGDGELVSRWRAIEFFAVSQRREYRSRA